MQEREGKKNAGLEFYQRERNDKDNEHITNKRQRLICEGEGKD